MLLMLTSVQATAISFLAGFCTWKRLPPGKEKNGFTRPAPAAFARSNEASKFPTWMTRRGRLCSLSIVGPEAEVNVS
jgi:hypothetical protein